MPSVDLLILDLDGTIFSSGDTTVGAVTRAVDELNERHGHVADQPTGEQILAGIGSTEGDYIRTVFPSLEGRFHDEMIELIWRWERRLIEDGHGGLFPGVRETLEELGSGGLTLAIASNAKSDYMSLILDHFGIGGHFDQSKCAGSEGTTDKAHLVRDILETLEVEARRAVMAGDRESDVRAARSCGTWSVGCTWGFGSRGEIAGADRIIDRFPDLAALLHGWP